MWYVLVRVVVHTEMRERDFSVNLTADLRIILKWVLRNRTGPYTGYMWLSYVYFQSHICRGIFVIFFHFC